MKVCFRNLNFLSTLTIILLNIQKKIISVNFSNVSPPHHSNLCSAISQSQLLPLHRTPVKTQEGAQQSPTHYSAEPSYQITQHLCCLQVLSHFLLCLLPVTMDQHFSYSHHYILWKGYKRQATSLNWVKPLEFRWPPALLSVCTHTWSPAVSKLLGFKHLLHTAYY